MGSFYSTCSVSSMTLSNQKTSIQLLAPNHSTDFSEHLNMVVSNDGAQAFFSPFGFPIHGEYYDYGRIENIVRDKNVEMLEDFFGITIDNILENIGDDRYIPENIKNIEIFKKLGMTYYRTEVLEYLQSGWNNIDLVNPKEYSSGSRMTKLLKSLEDRKVDHSRYEELLKIGKNKTEDQKEELYEIMDLMSNSLKRENSYVNSLARPNMFTTLPITTEFKECILKQYQYIKTLGFELSRLLIPSVYGSQETNWASQYKLNDFVNDLLAGDMKYELDNNGWVGDEETEEYEIVKDHAMKVRDRKINRILD